MKPLGRKKKKKGKIPRKRILKRNQRVLGDSGAEHRLRCIGRSSVSHHLVEGFSQHSIMKEASWDKISPLVMTRQCWALWNSPSVFLNANWAFGWPSIAISVLNECSSSAVNSDSCDQCSNHGGRLWCAVPQLMTGAARHRILFMPPQFRISLYITQHRFIYLAFCHPENSINFGICSLLLLG